jgi:hypothetical protein
MSELLKVYYDECDHYMEYVLKLKRLIKKVECSPEQVEKGDLLSVKNSVHTLRECLAELEYAVCSKAIMEIERLRYEKDSK